MLHEHIERSLPYSAGQLFDLAADIERYPQFLPWWIAATVRSREVNRCLVDNVIGLGPVRVTFASEAVLRRPERIDVTSNEAPFRHFRLTWLFVSTPGGNGAGCQVSLTAELELRSMIMQRFVEVSLLSSLTDIIAAFETRASELYAAESSRQPTPSP